MKASIWGLNLEVHPLGFLRSTMARLVVSSHGLPLPDTSARWTLRVGPYRIYINCMCNTSMSRRMVTPTAKNAPPETWGKKLGHEWFQPGFYHPRRRGKTRSIICWQQRRSSKCWYSTLELMFFFKENSHPPLITACIIYIYNIYQLIFLNFFFEGGGGGGTFFFNHP